MATEDIIRCVVSVIASNAKVACVLNANKRKRIKDMVCARNVMKHFANHHAIHALSVLDMQTLSREKPTRLVPHVSKKHVEANRQRPVQAI